GSALLEHARRCTEMFSDLIAIRPRRGSLLGRGVERAVHRLELGRRKTQPGDFLTRPGDRAAELDGLPSRFRVDAALDRRVAADVLNAPCVLLSDVEGRHGSTPPQDAAADVCDCRNRLSLDFEGDYVHRHRLLFVATVSI